MKRFLNIVLLPREVYRKLTDNKSLLILGIIIVGLINMSLPDIAGTCLKYFKDKPNNILYRNIIIFSVLVILSGLIDVLVMSIPLRDLFKVFKKEKDSADNTSAIKIMKIYVISHLLIIPVNIVLYFTVFKDLSLASNTTLIGFALFYYYLVMIWSTAIMYRGINSLYSFQPLFKRLVFSVVLLWSFLWGTVLEYLLEILDKVLVL